MYTVPKRKPRRIFRHLRIQHSVKSPSHSYIKDATSAPLLPVSQDGVMEQIEESAVPVVPGNTPVAPVNHRNDSEETLVQAEMQHPPEEEDQETIAYIHFKVEYHSAYTCTKA